jgi:vancomycin resistance protein VanW
MKSVKLWHGLAILPFIGMLWLLIASKPPAANLMAEFTTSLTGRTPGQRHNSEWAANKIDGTVIKPGQTFSFNRRVGPWGRREGVVRAPVSFGGILVPSWGGGVCQTSTTLYCAALLAGLEIVERHSHEIAPSYIPAGMDAAVAQELADLRFKNPYPFPVTMECFIEKELLTCRIITLESLPAGYKPCRLERELVSVQPAPQARGLKPQRGRPGMRVRLWRLQEDNGKQVRELCHETEYAPLARSSGL